VTRRNWIGLLLMMVCLMISILWGIALGRSIPGGANDLHPHAKVRSSKGADGQPLFPARFVLHSLRHTALTRFGEAGADAFTIMKLAGHSSVMISQRYVHPTDETVERMFDQLEALNNKKAKNSAGGEK